MSMTESSGGDMSNAQQSPPPRYSFQVPEGWPHYDGPLHGLLGEQKGKCAICSERVRWSSEGPGTDRVVACSFRQWVDDDLLLGLVCARCSRRYRTLRATADGKAVRGLPRFLADPPGQRCAATAGLGRQSRPRRFNSLLAPTEVPSPESWSYSNTVMHSLFLWQRGRCAICSTGLPVVTRARFVHVDHDDDTGLIRGLLCHRCNTCLGQDWQHGWWEHHAPTVAAYEEFPPAQICPATRGLTMRERKRPAALSWSADRNEILLDGMPKGIASDSKPAPPPSKWFALQYKEVAPPGLPPALEASLLMLTSDDGGDWFAFYMDPPLNAALRQPQCVLKVKQTDVRSVTEHATLQDALAAAFRSTD
ncbi:endonuclease domain-containing protein [Nocardioides zhouii]|uniref:Uncharacterized protein n=1 Tax=Nocardioides zhouii TaxID=1168729 RepID=A0A4Q2SKG6_9ACTN|nr:endonuclease domain-containing protein [Nocardioides zhouii]RYC05633.1 hypothetical protein EUA94_17960 [Nocardioides zhouii]